MNIGNYTRKTTEWLQNWLLDFLQLQLFLTIFSLPILVAWGLPVSALTILGNLIFTPFLTVFLSLSCLIFFCELLYIPQGWLIYALEKITIVWFKILNIPQLDWLVGFIAPPMPLLLLLPIVALFIIIHQKTRTQWLSIICFIALLITICGYSYFARPANNHTTIACNKGQLHIISKNNCTTVIDPGYLGQRISAESWVQYRFLPQFMQQTGQTTIDHLILLQPGISLFNAITRLTHCVTIKNIYLVCWEETMKKSGLYAYGAMRRACIEKKINLVRFAQHSVSIPMSPDTTIVITPLSEKIKTPTISYPACAIHTQIDNNDITFYSAKYINNKELSDNRLS
ncbi:MAG TPA: hypothetical protein VGT41_01370 [Candidatus Babeliales bacterium]|nr:hypothetical protein [Candidatus Babeliales bacterium]